MGRYSSLPRSHCRVARREPPPLRATPLLFLLLPDPPYAYGQAAGRGSSCPNVDRVSFFLPRRRRLRLTCVPPMIANPHQPLHLACCPPAPMNADPHQALYTVVGGRIHQYDYYCSSFFSFSPPFLFFSIYPKCGVVDPHWPPPGSASSASQAKLSVPTVDRHDTSLDSSQQLPFSISATVQCIEQPLHIRCHSCSVI